MSEIRKKYFMRLFVRIMIFIGCVILCFYPKKFDILNNMNFLKEFSLLHILWCIWLFDMFYQIIPLKNKVALGSQKLFKNRFKQSKEKVDVKALKRYIKTTTISAYKIFIIWTLLIILIGILYYNGIINKIGLFMITVFFYVCDLICVLVWCPFRLIMKNKCCTTCRIFNWDHLMMFSPLIFAGGFYSLSLVIIAILAWLVWEVSFLIYPERFFEATNIALRCSNCTDKLCTQYCKKINKKF